MFESISKLLIDDASVTEECDRRIPELSNALPVHSNSFYNSSKPYLER